MISPPLKWILDEKDKQDVFINEQDGCQREFQFWRSFNPLFLKKFLTSRFGGATKFWSDELPIIIGSHFQK